MGGNGSGPRKPIYNDPYHVILRQKVAECRARKADAQKLRIAEGPQLKTKLSENYDELVAECVDRVLEESNTTKAKATLYCKNVVRRHLINSGRTVVKGDYPTGSSKIGDLYRKTKADILREDYGPKPKVNRTPMFWHLLNLEDKLE